MIVLCGWGKREQGVCLRVGGGGGGGQACICVRVCALLFVTVTEC